MVLAADTRMTRRLQTPAADRRQDNPPEVVEEERRLMRIHPADNLGQPMVRSERRMRYRIVLPALMPLHNEDNSYRNPSGFFSDY
jgi:hypothetical protein